MTQQSVRTNPSEETIRVGPVGIRFLLTGDDSNGSMAMFEFTVPARQGLAVPPHSHDAYEETAYGIEGTLTLTVDGREVLLGPGEAVCIPRGAVHSFANLGSTDAKGVTVASPAAIGPAYFREAAAVVDVAAGGPPDRAKMAEVMMRHGLTPAAPHGTR